MRKRLLSTLVIIIASCSKEPAPTSDPVPVGKKVIKISSNAEDFQVFEYGLNGVVSKYFAQWTNGAGSLNKITHAMEYIGDRLEKVTNDVGYTIYSYQNNLVSKAENFFLNGKRLSTLLFN